MSCLTTRFLLFSIVCVSTILTLQASEHPADSSMPASCLSSKLSDTYNYDEASFKTGLNEAVREAVATKHSERLLTILRIGVQEGNVEAQESLFGYLTDSKRAGLVGLRIIPEHAAEARDIFQKACNKREKWINSFGDKIGKKFLKDYESAVMSIQRQMIQELIEKWAGYISINWHENPIARALNVLSYNQEFAGFNKILKPLLQTELKEILTDNGHPYYIFELVKGAMEKENRHKVKTYVNWAKKLSPVDLCFDVRSHAQFGLRGSISNRAALELYNICASNNYAEGIDGAAEITYSMFYAAEIYEHGYEGQQPDKFKALELYEKSAALCNLSSMHNAALLLGQGFEGQRPDMPRALEYLERAANGGLSDSMLLLGLYYLRNSDRNDNFLKTALFWLESANTNGNRLAGMYLEMAKRFAAQLEGEEQTKLVTEAETKDLIKLTEQAYSAVKEPNITELESLLTVEIPIDGKDALTLDDTLIVDMPADVDEGQSADSATRPVETSKYSFWPKSESGNPKRLREQLRAAGKKKLEMDALHTKPRELSTKNKAIVGKINNNDTKLSIHDINSLFMDPYFKNQVNISKTKSGITVKSVQRNSTGTHRKHTKDYDGLHRNFIKGLQVVLESFGLGGEAV